jgi:hypothetical protein
VGAWGLGSDYNISSIIRSCKGQHLRTDSVVAPIDVSCYEEGNSCEYEVHVCAVALE